MPGRWVGNRTEQIRKIAALRVAPSDPVPATEQITVRGHLVDASDDGYRARIHSRLTVSTPSVPSTDWKATTTVKTVPTIW